MSDKITFETVLEVKHFTDNLFWFKTTKPEALKDVDHVTDGEFVMIGLPDLSIPMRAYSFANPVSDDHLEFLSIHVPQGALTSELVKINVGDKVRVDSRAHGSLLLQALDFKSAEEAQVAGRARRLWMMSTGTGLAPFLSLARSEILYDKDLNLFEDVIVTHTCRTEAELVFGDELRAAGAKVYQSVTREDPTGDHHAGRITDLLRTGAVFEDLGFKERALDPEWDRVMLCGNLPFNKELISMLEASGFVIGTTRSPGSYLKETAFVDK